MNFLSSKNLEKSLLFSDFVKSKILRYLGFLLEMKMFRVHSEATNFPYSLEISVFRMMVYYNSELMLRKPVKFI